jgi:WD40 repeat protein
VIFSVTFSPDGKSILTGSADKTARLWDLQGNVIKVFKGHGDIVHSVAFSPDGKNILTGSADNTACLWDLQGNVLQVFTGHEKRINSVAFSPDGKSILTGSWDKTARLWDLQGNVLRVFKGNESYISSVAFSPDGKSILTGCSTTEDVVPGSGDKTARLWDLQGNILQVFTGHESSIHSVAFSPDGKSILTGSMDRTARLWKIKKTHKEFQSENAYQELSISQKIKYGILEFNDVLKLNDEKSIDEAAEYYYEELSSVGKDKNNDYINNAINLYNKLVIKYKNTKYIARKDSLMLIQKE